MIYYMFLLIVLSMPVIAMEDADQDANLIAALENIVIRRQVSTPKREAKMRAQRKCFFSRLPYFNSVADCEQEMTTDVDSDEQLFTQNDYMQYKAASLANRIARDARIKARSKNLRVEAALLKLTTDDEAKSLYAKLTQVNLRQMPIQKELTDLGYEADVERIA